MLTVMLINCHHLAGGGHSSSRCLCRADQTSDCDVAAGVRDLCEKGGVSTAVFGQTVWSEIPNPLQPQLSATSGLHQVSLGGDSKKIKV